MTSSASRSVIAKAFGRSTRFSTSLNRILSAWVIPWKENSKDIVPRTLASQTGSESSGDAVRLSRTTKAGAATM